VQADQHAGSAGDGISRRRLGEDAGAFEAELKRATHLARVRIQGFE
jgi:hypothetical protein